MASFFGDIFDAVTGQQATPQSTIIPTNELLGQSFGAAAGQVAPGILAFNQALAPGMTDIQLGVANQLDPSILANFRGANRSILDQLNLGTRMDPELERELVGNLMESGAQTGFGGSSAGLGNVLLQQASAKEALRQQRVQNALGAGTSGMGVSGSLYNPDLYSQLGMGAASGIAQNIQQVQAAQDEAVNMAEDIRRQNFSALLNTGGKIAGSVIGGIYGGPMGAQMGGNIGGSMIQGSRVGGQRRGSAIGGQQYGIGGQGGGGDYMSMLSGLFGGGKGVAASGFTTGGANVATPGAP